MSPLEGARLTEQAVRLFRRYQVEIVEALHLCPWAVDARLAGAVEERVLLGRSLDLGQALEAVTSLEERPQIEIGILLLPEAQATHPELERFVSRLAEADAGRRELGTAPFAFAAFHPAAPMDLTDGERLIPFLRRTPDPTIQLVRRASLERVREGHHEGTAFVDVRALTTLGKSREDTLPLRERIARSNLRTTLRLGPAALEAKLAEIRADRDAAYGLILENA